MLCAPRQLSTLQQPACMGVFKQLNTYQNALAIQVGTICNRDTFVEFSVNHFSSRAVTASGAYSYACQFIHIVTSEGTGPGTS